jgi:protoporphyrinogen oxidase
MKIAVIGAGAAGLTAAYQISREISSGKVTSLDIYEAGSQVGGLARSINIWNQKTDMGPHRFFSNDKKVNGLWLEVVGKDYKMVNRKTRIYYKKKFFDYPLKPLNALKNMGLFEAAWCMLSYMKEKIIPTKDTGTFESWVTKQFGKRLYQIFFKTYSEKLWGIKCTELDSDFASQRIKRLSLFEAVKNAILSGKGNVHKTLVDQFAYPTGGTGMVYENMAAFISKNGGTIYLNASVNKVLTSEGKVTGLQLDNGELKYYDHIISTMPLSLLVTRLPEVPENIKQFAMSLKFRNTILVYLRVNHSSLFPDQWLYIHSGDIIMGRMTNFRNWIPELYGNEKDSILCIEYWCNFDDPFWQIEDKELIDLARKEVLSTGLIKDEAIPEGHIIRIPRSYPVYFRNYRKILAPIQDYLDTIEDLQVIGRYGAYKYNNQDHSIFMGLLAAENVLYNKNNDLWGINTDYDTYQESSVISETGLVDIQTN